MPRSAIVPASGSAQPNPTDVTNLLRDLVSQEFTESQIDGYPTTNCYFAKIVGQCFSTLKRVNVDQIFVSCKTVENLSELLTHGTTRKIFRRQNLIGEDLGSRHNMGAISAVYPYKSTFG